MKRLWTDSRSSSLGSHLGRFRRTVAALATVTLLCLPAAAWALGGPVLIGGDDADDHGSFDGLNNQTGWLYIEDGFNTLGPNVSNGNTVAVCLGCNGSGASGGFESGFDLSNLPGLGWTRVTLTVVADITAFFDGSGVTNVNVTRIHH